MFAAPRLFVQTMPIQSAGVSGRGNRIIPRWRPNKNKNECRSPQWEKTQAFDIFQTPLSSHYPLTLRTGNAALWQIFSLV
jgi:hypothetical protein